MGKVNENFQDFSITLEDSRVKRCDQMLKAFKFRLYPTQNQQVLLAKHFGTARWVYNWALAEKMARYSEEGQSVSIYELQRQLPELKEREETKWLADVSAQSLCGALMALDKAYTRFFKEKRGFPKFKSRHDNHQSFQNHQHNRIFPELGLIKILKFQEGIKCRFTRPIEGKIKTMTISKTPSGKYWASILVETPEVEPPLMPAEEAKALGLDFGVKDLIVTSDGQRFVNPRTLKKFLRTLAIRSRRHTRTQKGSHRREKSRIRVAKVHEHISNIRRDHLHKITTHLVRENQATTLCIEDLNVSGMMRDRRKGNGLRRSISDVGFGELRRQLEYKCKWAGKNLRVIGEFEPSSKTCSNCGRINRELTLSQREWTCDHCGTHHDRDINAAINIKKMAFREQNTYSTPQSNQPVCETASGSLTKTIPAGSRKSTPVEQAVRPAMNREDKPVYEMTHGSNGVMPNAL